MSDISQNLIIDLQMDQIGPGNQVSDTSGNGLDGIAVSGMSVVPNDTVGAVISFDGGNDFVWVPNNAAFSLDVGQDFTVEVWVSVAPAQTTSGDIVIVEKWDGFSPAYPYSIRYNTNGTIYASRYDGNQRPSITSAGRINDGRLHHVAFVRQAGLLKLYIDGVIDTAAPGGVRDTTTLSTNNTAALNWGGRGSACSLAGQLGPSRIYDCGLTADQIDEDMTGDTTSTRAYTRAQPIDFSLYNENDATVIYIDSASSGHTLQVQIDNVDGQDIVFGALQSVSSTSYHFALRFRPGTLSDDSLSHIAIATAGFTMAAPAVQLDGSVTLYLMGPSGTRLTSAAPLVLNFNNVSANPSGGSRETQVELSYQALTFSGETTPVTGTRIHRIALVREIQSSGGGVEAPFVISFQQMNRILNNGQTGQQLTLRLTNVTDQTITLNAADSDTPTSLVFSVDVDTDGTRPWALGTATSLQHFSVSANTGSWGTAQVSNEAETVECTLTPSANVTIAAGDSLFFTLTNLCSTLPSGQALAYVRYSNIAGIDDGEVTCVIEKAPLAYSTSTTTLVGINKTNPSVELDVNGSMTASANVLGNNVIATNTVSGSSVTATSQLSANSASVTNTITAGSYAGGMGIVQPGMVMMWAGTTSNIPVGWHLCDGSYLSQSTYAALYAAIGTTYGGGSMNGNPIFYLPNLTERFVVGTGGQYHQGSIGGAAGVELGTNEVPAHTHTTTCSSDGQHHHTTMFDTGGTNGNASDSAMPTVSWASSAQADQYMSTSTQSAHSHSIVINSTGGNESGHVDAHENRPPYLALCFIIYTGVSTR